jgi:FkbM family methyltransferase
MRLVPRIEQLLEGTPLEPMARRVYQHVHAMGHPRAQQSLRYDRDTARILARVLRTDSSCADVGAHRGSLLEVMVRLAPKGRHFAFEPVPELAARLRRRFPEVEVHQVALSDATERSTFYHVVDDPGLSGLRRLPKVRPDAAVREITVSTRRLDEMIPPDVTLQFLKVDVEGAHLQVLRGGSNTIRRCRPTIVFEHGYMARETYATTSAMVWDLLVEQFGLRISQLADWLGGAPALTQEAFCASVGLHAGSEFCFVSHPDA